MSDQQHPSVPVHLGVIPDGNRRWAKDQGKMSISGHRAGLEVAKAMSMAAFDRGIKYFTMFAFSTENWARAEDEVGYLMDLFYGLVTDELGEIHDRGVRFVCLGSRERLPERLREAMAFAEEKTAGNTHGTLAIALNYGGEQEIVDAVLALQASGHKGPVTAELIASHLYAPDIPAVDLIIRTSGEHRLSGFMLWRASYAEFRFIDKHWPDFTEADLDAAITDYSQRDRRFGA